MDTYEPEVRTCFPTAEYTFCSACTDKDTHVNANASSHEELICYWAVLSRWQVTTSLQCTDALFAERMGTAKGQRLPTAETANLSPCPECCRCCTQ